MEKVEVIVIGAGVVGLAVAAGLARAGREVIVVESADAFGAGTSSRNSEVIHAGIYYPKDSLKARLCVAGKQALYEFCGAHDVNHRRCGKLIIAASDRECAVLGALEAKALANGVDDLVRLDRHAACALEPALDCRGALLSPSTGIIDSHGYMLAMIGDIEAAGGMVALNSPALGGRAADGAFTLKIGGAAPMELSCALLVNAAGLGAQAFANSLDGLPPESVPPLYYAKGNYFTLTGACPFSHLIYPAPEVDALGIHVVLDLAGATKFGPDIEWIDAPDYAVPESRAASFEKSIRRYWPALPDKALQPGYAGVRPKLGPQGTGFTDFIIQDRNVHGIDGLINLYGIDSPGLTASPAIADEVAKRILV